MGILHPTKVTRLALEDAASVAELFRAAVWSRSASSRLAVTEESAPPPGVTDL
jgi:hypothetical protein